ncbi:alpha/beta fold hydrolase [Mesorhizobium sp. ANAO-SY3R2]|uniref:alpha/beta fold hydrolase n=1 Tax=Mesorhizobium sp. ANAO-SY3R2 TaxID=3166644 RepID=UPI00366DF951
MATLFLLHGAPGDGTLWRPVVEALPAGLQVATPTMRWFGSGAWDDDGSAFSTEIHADQLIALVGAEATLPVAVAAWSWSSHVALLALIKRPDLFAKAFLYEPGLHTYLASDELPAYGADAGAAFGPVAAALADHGPQAAVEALFESSGGEGCYGALDPERRARYLESVRMMPLLMGGGRPPADITAADLATISVPLTVAYGSRTRPLFAIASQAVARAVPDAKELPVEGADHMLPEKDPARFAALLGAWL